MMISFNNTENAFKTKSNSELRRTWFLFKLIGNNFLVKFGTKVAPIAFHIGFKGFIKNTIFKQFVGGENIEECLETVDKLKNQNISSILDYIAGEEETEENFNHCLNETLETINKAKGNKNIPFCVFKVTGLARFDLLMKVSAKSILTNAENTEWERVKGRVNKICQSAFGNDQAILIDAEESWIQPAIDKLVNENMKVFNKAKAIVYNTYQLYRQDMFSYLKQTINEGKDSGFHIGAKLVRGAYMEKERERAEKMNYVSPIQPNKETCDKDYENALKLCLENINIMGICVGTHNEKSNLFLVELMEKGNLKPSDERIFFAQLLGMGDHISYNLSLNGYNVAKYVPYGPVKNVLPYLIRRAQENTSIRGQTGRELNLITGEIKRRAAKKD